MKPIKFSVFKEIINSLRLDIYGESVIAARSIEVVGDRVRITTGEPMLFSIFLDLVNRLSYYPDLYVYADQDPVIDIATTSGLAACNNRWHGEQKAEPSKVQLVVIG